MSNKVPPLSFNHSIKYNVGNKPQQAQAKPKVLSIASVSDDNTVVIDYVDQRGILFNKTGNFELPLYAGAIDREDIVLGGVKAETPQFSKPDFAIVRICDPDSNQKGLELARQIIEQNKIPALNPPEKILATRRDLFYQRFADFDEKIIVPKTLRIAPRYCREVEGLLEKGEVRLPCIFRPAGGHNSRGVALLSEPRDANELERFAFDGRDYYISELHDCRDNDGLYRKFRVVYVDGKMYPRHFFVSDSWCVDGKSKFTEQKYLDEEKYFVENFEAYLGEEAVSKLGRFCAAMELDYFGLDANLRPDGTLVVFEANACMAAFRRSGRDYLEPQINAIRLAAKEMLLRFYRTVKAQG